MKTLSRSARFIQCPPSSGWCVARPLTDARHGFAISGTFDTLALARAAMARYLRIGRGWRPVGF